MRGEAARSKVKEPTDGCDSAGKSNAEDYAFKRALPQDQFDDAPAPTIDGDALITSNKMGEIDLIKDLKGTFVTPAICVYSDEAISVAIPASVLTQMALDIRRGMRRKLETAFGMSVPRSQFSVPTFWLYKRSPSNEFSEALVGTSTPELVHYQGRQALFDSSRKLVLFTDSILFDEQGHLIADSKEPQRIDLNDGLHPVMLKVEGYIDSLLFLAEERFWTTFQTLRPQ